MMMIECLSKTGRKERGGRGMYLCTRIIFNAMVANPCVWDV